MSIESSYSQVADIISKSNEILSTRCDLVDVKQLAIMERWLSTAIKHLQYIQNVKNWDQNK